MFKNENKVFNANNVPDTTENIFYGNIAVCDALAFL
jgi:hypothetical protein